MKESKVLEQVKFYNQDTADSRTLEKFRKMQQFIDGGLQKALSQDGPEKIGTLVTTLLNLRDFLASDMFENSFKVNLLANIQNLEQLIEKEEKEAAEAESMPEESQTEDQKKKKA